jgi:hypothetical protein
MALVERWQTDHEKICATRWSALIKLIGWGGALAVTIMLAVAGWGLNKTFDGQKEQMQMLRDMQARVEAIRQ